MFRRETRRRALWLDTAVDFPLDLVPPLSLSTSCTSDNRGCPVESAAYDKSVCVYESARRRRGHGWTLIDRIYSTGLLVASNCVIAVDLLWHLTFTSKPDHCFVFTSRQPSTNSVSIALDSTRCFEKPDTLALSNNCNKSGPMWFWYKNQSPFDVHLLAHAVFQDVLKQKTILGTFYRAMLCIARTIMSQNVSFCPSVCLSVTRRYYVETAKHIIKLLHCRVATTF